MFLLHIFASLARSNGQVRDRAHLEGTAFSLNLSCHYAALRACHDVVFFFSSWNKIALMKRQVFPSYFQDE